MKKPFQSESVDNELRYRLWNCLDCTIHYQIKSDEDLGVRDRLVWKFVEKIWDGYFKKPIDGISHDWLTIRRELRRYFLNFKWYSVYDYLEYLINNFYDKAVVQDFVNKSNKILEEESSAYRFVGGKVVEITSKEEISEIEKALVVPLTPVQIHLQTSLNMLSDKKNPDYRELNQGVHKCCRINM